VPQTQNGDAAFKRHVLPYAYFQSLSIGGGDSALVEYLWRTQLSRRKLLLNELFGEIERDGGLLGKLPPPASVFQVLKAAQTANLAEVDQLLLHPEVGGWIAYTLRRRRGGAERYGHVPLWVDFGGVHILCLIAAARTGLAWQTRVPHRDGRVMLFGRGMAQFSGLSAEETIEAETAVGHITLRVGTTTIDVPAESADGADDDVRWWGLRRLRVGDSLPIDVCLDDIDPFRDLADPVPPRRLSEANAVLWWDLFDEAWKLLCDHHAETAKAVAAGVVSLVPLPLGDGRETRSASSGEAFGSVMLSQPPDPVTLACSLVHEFQHIKLGGLMHLMRLVESEDTERYYAPWRDDPRPLGGLLQGVYAFFGIAAFWRRHRQTASRADDRLIAEFEYAYTRTQTSEALDIVLASGGLTVAGRRFAEALLDQFQPWLSDEVDPSTLTAARLVTDRHRTGWRMRHQRVRAQEIDALVEAWRHDRAATVDPAPPDIGASPAARWSQGMVGLVRRRILVPRTWSTFDGSDGNWWREAVSEGDMAIVEGQVELARALYLEAVQAHAEDPDAWSGLAVTLCTADRTKGDTAAGLALLRRPELVREVYARLSQHGDVKDPLHVATWLGQAMTSA
jgi:HEXXH motif-containing protein